MNLGVLRVVGIVVFLYLTWRNLRDNYKDDDLIAYAWEGLLAFLLGGRIGYGLINWGVWNTNIWDWVLVWQKPGMNYEGAFLALIATTILIAVKRNWKVWMFLEEIMSSVLVLMVLMIGDEFVRSRFNGTLGLVLILLIVCIGIASLIKKRYRSFAWYKSGKSGFMWFFINFIFWLVMSVYGLVWWNNDVQTFIYMVLSLTSLIGLFILGDVFDPLLIFGKRKK